jgi:hypothetical protein
MAGSRCTADGWDFAQDCLNRTVSPERIALAVKLGDYCRAFGRLLCYTAASISVNWKQTQQKAARTARWAVTMTKVRIRQVVSRTRWQLITFYGKSGAESVGVVDMLAIRKDHSAPVGATRRGDALQIILIQVKGGSAARPTWKDATRLRAVAKKHGACNVLLSTWKKGTKARFFRLRRASATDWTDPWIPVTDLDSIFR